MCTFKSISLDQITRYFKSCWWSLILICAIVGQGLSVIAEGADETCLVFSLSFIITSLPPPPPRETVRYAVTKGNKTRNKWPTNLLASKLHLHRMCTSKSISLDQITHCSKWRRWSVLLICATVGKGFPVTCLLAPPPPPPAAEDGPI